jgi:ParB family chromosome partitioning protein
MKVPASLIRAGNNDRTVFAAEKLKGLATSIARHGLIQAITLRPVDGGEYEIVAGERRFRAMTEVLGWTEVPAEVKERDDLEASAAMLLENIHRVDLDPIDEAVAYSTRMTRLGCTPAELAEDLGISVNRVQSYLPLLKLVREAQHLIRFGQLPIDIGWTMADLDANRQRMVLRAIDDGLEKPAVRSMCARLRDEQRDEPMFDADSFLQLDDYVADAKATAKVSKPKRMAAVITRLLALVDDVPADLAAEARELVA